MYKTAVQADNATQRFFYCNINLLNIDCYCVIIIIYKKGNQNMKIKSIIKKSAIISILLLIVCSSFTAKAEEATSKSENRFYLGESMKTGWDNGYKNEEKIKEGDPHFGWKIGDFYVEGFTSVVKDDDGNPIFLKNVGDKVKLLFRLDQDLNKLNDNDNLSISEDTNGSDEYFSIAKTNFQHGALIIRKTGYTNAKEEPVIYTDYLSAKVSVK